MLKSQPRQCTDMNELNITKCLTCGGELAQNASSGAYVCKSCKRVYPKRSKSYFEDLKNITAYRQVKDFERAYQLCEEQKSVHPRTGEVYWQAFLCDCGVIYIQDIGEVKPALFNYQYNQQTSVLENINCKKAIEYAQTGIELDYYVSQAKQIEKLIEEFYVLVEKESSYDIFISCKPTKVEKGSDGKLIVKYTDDYKKALELYSALNNYYKVFFAPMSIGQEIGVKTKRYAPGILKALKTSQAMILVSSSYSNVMSQWVQKEWQVYLHYLSKKLKKPNSLLYVCDQEFMKEPPQEFANFKVPVFDMYKSTYLIEVKDYLTLVRGVYNNKIPERKINVDFLQDDYFVYSDEPRFNIENRKYRSVALSEDEVNELASAEAALTSGKFFDASRTYSALIRKNPKLSKAYWGRFCAKIKAKNEQEIVLYAHLANADAYDDVDKAIEFSDSIDFSKHIIDLLIAALNKDVDWKDLQALCSMLVKYIDNSKLEWVLRILGNHALKYIGLSKVKIAEDIYASAKRLFFAGNRAVSVNFANIYASNLHKNGYRKLSEKYFEMLIQATNDADNYLRLLECRFDVASIENINLKSVTGPSAANGVKSAKELETIDLIERMLICDCKNNTSDCTEEFIKCVLYQQKQRAKNMKFLIETVVSCLVQMDKEYKAVDFLIRIANGYIMQKEFDLAKVYLDDVIARKQNASKAYWALLKCKHKAQSDADLAKKASDLLESPEFRTAVNYATGDEYNYYFAVYNGKI